MRRFTALVAVVPLLLIAACGSDDEPSSDSTTGSDNTTTPVGSDGTPPTVDAPAPTVDLGDIPDSIDLPSGGSGTATVTLDSGDSFEFDGVMCMLESQTVAGSEILFTATAYGDPGLDVTQFGSEGVVADVASVEIYDGDYNTLWASDSMFGIGDTELTLDGNTIHGSGEFLHGDDAMPGDGVQGAVVVNC